MSNFKHGFFSKNASLNPDSRMMGTSELSLDDLSIADSYLRGETVKDPVHAHNAIKAIYAAGKFKYPTIWDRAKRYCTENYEFDAMEKLSKLGERKL